MDTLTGLPNRLHLAERLGAAVADTRGRNTGVAVLFVDLDRFKIVNDTFGHEVGDALMVAVADRLREALRPGDQVVRYGGDEFVAICPEITNAGAAERIARRVIAALVRAVHDRAPEPEHLELASASPSPTTTVATGRGRAARRRRGHVPGQGRRRRLATARSTAPLGNSLTPSAIEARLREAVERQRVPGLLPAGRPHRRRRHRGRRGPAALGRPRARAARARRVPPDRSRRPASSSRSAPGCSTRPAGRPPSGAPPSPTTTLEHHGERVGPPAQPSRLRRAHRRGARRHRAAPHVGVPRDHRERPDGRRRVGLDGAARGQDHSASGSRSTTSAPATRRSATSGASRSTC